MPINDLPGMLLQAVSEHIPSGAAWVPAAALSALAALGLLFMTKGARLAPIVAAIVLAAAGAVAGTFVSRLIGTPLWPTVTASGAFGLALGVVLFRIWLGLFVAGFLIVASLSLYADYTLRVPLDAYLSRGLDIQRQQVTLKEATAATPGKSNPQAELASLWSYLTESVPAFQTNFFTIVGAAGVAGLVFALVLPRLARAFWAATLGTALLLAATYALVQTRFPAAGEWFNQWAPIIAGVLWGISLICNVADVHGIRLKKPASAAAKPAAA